MREVALQAFIYQGGSVSSCPGRQYKLSATVIVFVIILVVLLQL